MSLSETDLVFLTRAIDLAQQALDSGDEPFGSVLVDPQGEVLFEDHNHVAGGDQTQHPELAIARWAAQNLSPEQRRECVVYTSGEHCPMCSAAHGWVGLGRIVYATSGAQLGEWLAAMGMPRPPVAGLSIEQVVPGAVVAGPHPNEAIRERIRRMHAQSHGVSTH